jgi:hypothetical protein
MKVNNVKKVFIVLGRGQIFEGKSVDCQSGASLVRNKTLANVRLGKI